MEIVITYNFNLLSFFIIIGGLLSYAIIYQIL